MEIENGKLFDVLVEDSVGINWQTGGEKIFGFIVWADVGMIDIIRGVSGVRHVSEFGTCYHVDLDPRYEREWVRSEIESAIKCAPSLKDD